MVHFKIKVPNIATVREKLRNTNYRMIYFIFNVSKLKTGSCRIQKSNFQIVDFQSVAIFLRLRGTKW